MLWHGANTVLLFLLLRSFTGAHWRSAIVAAFFAAHPLQVESVAWVAERKDLLSTCFGLASLCAYGRFAQKSAVPGSRFDSWYGVALTCFALALLSKPMLVTLPCVMLLLDFWPLGRLRPFTCKDWQLTLRRLVLEKVPFFALSAISCVITVIAQHRGGAVMSLDRLSLGERVGNVFVSYASYLGKLFWPVDLAAIYPHPGKWPLASLAVATLFVLAMCVIAWRTGRRLPFLATGWFWFLGMLVPVIGLVQVGSQSMADRYTYLPKVGVLIMLVWGVVELAARWQLARAGKAILVVVTGVLLVACGWRARDQVAVWRDSETLFRHALAVTTNNSIAHNNVATIATSKGHLDEAIEHYRAALKTKPYYVDAMINLGAALAQKGQTAEGIAMIQLALRLKPDDPMAHFNLAGALASQGNYNEAIREYREALRLQPDDKETKANLEKALRQLARADDSIGKSDPTVGQFLAAVERSPDNLEARLDAGIALSRAGKLVEAVVQFERALQISPGNASAHSNLAKVLAMSGQFEEAAKHAAAAIRVQPTNTLAHNTLGYVWARQNRPEEAVREYSETVRIDSDNFTAHYNLGDLLKGLGRREEAIKHFTEALRIIPDSKEAQASLHELAQN